MLDGQVEAVAAVKPQVETLARAADAAAARLADPAGRLAYAGAGTSGRLAVLDAVELVPTFGWQPERLLYGLAGGMEAMTRGVENAEDDEEAARDWARDAALGPSDVLVAVAASGTTPYTVAAAGAAAALGALTIGIASNAGTPLLAAVAYPILVETGPEIVSGSTRMKAGTAQKIALNLLSTAIMMRLGGVHDGLMVDMRVTNAKLRRRAIGIVAELAGVESDSAEAALDASDNAIKLAVLVARGMDLEQARRLLDAAGGNLRTALARQER